MVGFFSSKNIALSDAQLLVAITGKGGSFRRVIFSVLRLALRTERQTFQHCRRRPSTSGDYKVKATWWILLCFFKITVGSHSEAVEHTTTQIRANLRPGQ